MHQPEYPDIFSHRFADCGTICESAAKYLATVMTYQPASPISCINNFPGIFLYLIQ
jgi:hypothetical protein